MKFAFIKFCCVLLLLFNLYSLEGKSWKELSISPGYEMPFGYLKWSYSHGYSGRISFAFYKELNRKNGRSLDINISYTNLIPRSDKLYYLIDGNNYGIDVFKNYNIFTGSLSTRRHHSFNKTIGFFVGLDIRFCYLFYRFSSTSVSYKQDNYTLNEPDINIGGKYGFAPIAGLTYRLSKDMKIFIRGEYSFTNFPNGGSLDDFDTILSINPGLTFCF